MKNNIFLLIFISLFAFVNQALGQTVTTHKNAVVHSKFTVATINPADASNADKAITTITYADGLGRVLQSIGYQQSPTKKDIINGAVAFDQYGREIKTALPAPNTSNTGSYDGNAFSLSNAFYANTHAYNTTTKFDNSPLNRVREQFGAGAAWHAADKKILNNDESAGTDIRYYYIDVNGNIKLDGFFPANSLYKKRIVDEQGHTSIEILDKKGRLVQKQNQDDTGFATTYYLYDAIDRIVAVMQPEGYELNQSIIKNSSDWQNWVFAYGYDYRSRMNLKQVPAAGDEYMIYDLWDRLVWSQTALQRETSKWTFYKYDNFNREIIRGEKEDKRGFAALEAETWAWAGGRFESRTTTAIYYSLANSYPALGSDADIRLINYYDDYNNWLPVGMAFADGGTAFHNLYANSTGLMVGSRSRNDIDNSWMVSVSYFDNKGRGIRTFGHNRFGQIEQLDTEYNHAGEILQIKKTHKNQVGVATIDHTQHELDHAMRIKKVYHGINAAPTELVKHEYDEIGRQSQKKILPNDSFIAGGTKEFIERPLQGTVNQANTVDLAKRYVLLEPITSIDAINLNSYTANIDPNAPAGITISGLQTIDYTWHLRGGLLGINLDNAGNAVPKVSEGDLFSFRLDYENAGQWDGNIGRQGWRLGDASLPTSERYYLYNYDPLKRLKSASFTGIGSEDYSLPNLSYDKNGNITALQRKGQHNGSPGLIDNLTYNYSTTGNRLVGVSDGVSGNTDTGDFRDNTSNSDYTYYSDGSLKSDGNKTIQLIEYDTFLKKVKKITWNDGRWLRFFYDGSGTLLKRENSIGEYWDYANGLIYKNGVPYQLSISDGRAVYENGSWNYEFEYRDVWGNLRVAFNGQNGQLIKTQSSDYDALGFEYNKTSQAQTNKFKYQNQERVDDFNLGIDLFKYRPSDYQIGRFWQVDPLASEYLHNSVYAFQENKFGLGVELEGKELQPFYPSLQTEMLRSVGYDHIPNKKESYNLAKDLSIGAAKVYAGVMLMFLPIEDVIVGGLGLAAKELGLGSKIEGALLKTQRNVVKEVSSSETFIEKNTTKEQANNLVNLNNGKSRVTLRSEKSKVEIDLKGDSHFDKKTNTTYDTPHTKTSPRNYLAPAQKGPVFNTSEKSAQYSNTSQSDIRTVRKYLEKNK